MKLYRMAIEWDEYLGADEWHTHVFYKYVAGNRDLGKAVYDCYAAEERVTDVTILNFSIPALWTCLHKVTSEQYNQTCWERGH